MHSPYTYDTQHNIWLRPDAKKFAYSDGDQIEQRLMQILQKVQDKQVMSLELMQHMLDWPTRYHLSPRRANLLRPHKHLLENAHVLELGGGCGAITRYLGETAKKVTMLEGSSRRASIAALRCSDLSNVTIYADTIQNMEIPEGPFDVVTLIGVLEYARLYDPESKDATLSLLQKAASLLKPGGVFFLALENQLGLKYFAGAPEDHLGQPMLGINDVYDSKGIMTFGVQEMERYLNQAGFTYLEQFMPLPDYKLTTTVVHPEVKSIPDNDFPLGYFLQESAIHADKIPYTFSMEGCWPVVARNGLAWDLCNSLCFVARTSPKPMQQGTETTLVSHYGCERVPAFFKETLFVKTDKGIVVRREAVAPNAPKAAQCVTQQKYQAEEPFYPYKKFTDGFFKIVTTPGWQIKDIAEWLRPLIEKMRSYAVEHDGTLYVPSTMQDCNARNALLDANNEIVFIDLEWDSKEELMPFSFALMYSIVNTFYSLSCAYAPAANTPVNAWQISLAVLQYHGVTMTAEEEAAYLQWMVQFHSEVSGVNCTKGRFTDASVPITYGTQELIKFCVRLQDSIASTQQQTEQLLREKIALEKERDMLKKIIDKYTTTPK